MMSKDKKKQTDVQPPEVNEDVESKTSEVADLEQEVGTLKIENEKLKNDYYKAFADTENYKKRMQRELENSLKYRIQSFATSILPAMDNLERALSSASDEDPMKQGVSMIYDQISHALKAEGVEEIDAVGKPFDANLHQSIMAEKVEGVEPGQVIEVLQKGYVLKDRILRPSYVKVSE